jgi:hypothetical protein
MKIRSRILTARDFVECANAVNAEFPGCDVYVSTGDDDPTHLTRGPFKGGRRFDHVGLRSRTGRYRTNPGSRERHAEWEGELAASWAEWGWWLVRLFERDPDAACGDYRGVEDFHDKTNDRFREPRSPRERQIKRALERTG